MKNNSIFSVPHLEALFNKTFTLILLFQSQKIKKKSKKINYWLDVIEGKHINDMYSNKVVSLLEKSL